MYIHVLSGLGPCGQASIATVRSTFLLVWDATHFVAVDLVQFLFAILTATYLKVPAFNWLSMVTIGPENNLVWYIPRSFWVIVARDPQESYYTEGWLQSLHAASLAHSTTVHTESGYVHIDTSTSTSHVSGFRFTARTSFTRTNGAFMVTTSAHTPQRVSTDNLQ